MKILAAILAFLCVFGVVKDVKAQHETGVGILSLCHPKFPVNEAIKTLRKSPRPTFAFLYRTFGVSCPNLERLTSALADMPSVSKFGLSATVYVTCGPCRRPRRNGTLAHWRPDLTIDQLNSLLSDRKKKRKVLADYEREVRRVFSLTAKRAPWVRWRIAAELEDNLTLKGRRELLKIVAKVFQKSRYVLVENPLLPSLRSRPKTILEYHSYESRLTSQLLRGDIVFGDGVNEFPQSSTLKFLRDKGLVHLFWRPCWQGFDMRNPSLSVDRRRYSWCDSDLVEDGFR